MRQPSLNHGPAAEINMVPFMDVLLVLVAVLLLLSPFMVKSIQVDLPKTVTGAMMTQETSVTLEVLGDGTILLDGAAYDPQTAGPKLSGAVKARVFSDHTAPFGAVARVLDILAGYKIHNVQFGVKD